MLKRWIGIVFLILMSVSATSAQDGGSTLAAWADSPASAFNLTQQMGWPTNARQVDAISTYTAVGDPVLSCTTGHAYSVWVTFIAPQSGTVYLQTALGSNYDLAIGVYKTSPTTANEVDCFNAWSGATLNNESGPVKMVAGTRYYLMFAASGTGTNVDSSSSLSFSFIANASALNPFKIPATGSYNTVQSEIENAFGQTVSAGACGSGDYMVYYTFKPATTGRYEFSTAGSSYDTVLAIDQGGVQVGCNQDINANNASSRLRPTLTAGQTYLIGIGQNLAAVDQQTDDMVLSLRVRKL
jgi:hypothetical protein